MVDLSVGPSKFLLDLRKQGRSRTVALSLAAVFIVLAFGLTYITATLHFIVLSFVSICLIAWIGGLRAGITAAITLPILYGVFTSALGYPLANAALDTVGFIFLALACGTSIGILAELFGYAASAQRELKLFYDILPICSFCQRIRDEEDRWHGLESFLEANSNTELTHGICPDCEVEHYPVDAAPE